MEQQIKSMTMEYNIKFMLGLCDIIANDTTLGNYQIFVNSHYNHLNEYYEFGNGLKIHRTTMENYDVETQTYNFANCMLISKEFMDELIKNPEHYKSIFMQNIEGKKEVKNLEINK